MCVFETDITHGRHGTANKFKQWKIIDLPALSQLLVLRVGRRETFVIFLKH